jgi:hypothetical protein
MALPTFFIISAAKAAATRLLYCYLEQHPQIQISANNQPDFFSGPENAGDANRLRALTGMEFPGWSI